MQDHKKVEKLLLNLSIIANKYFDIYQKLINKPSKHINLNCDPLRLNQLFFKFFSKIMSDPERLMKYQMKFFKGQLETIDMIYKCYGLDKIFPNNQTQQIDNRFKDKNWQEHYLFAWFKEAYYNYSEWLDSVISDLPKDDFSAVELKRLHFISKQFIDAIAPSNFPSTNPEVVKAFFDTAGENFIHGLDHLLKDIEHSKQTLQILTTDTSKFALGKNIATTKGKIVYQNELIQLIHYTPLKKEVHATPLLIVSPFINKYYILDLGSQNSLVKWLLEQNYDVFLISWVNPDESLAEKNFADYMLQGPIAATEYITKTLEIEQINAVGYCIGGTLLATSLAYMKNIKDYRIKSASFFTTLIDFADAGELSIFIDDYFLSQAKEYMEKSGGYMDGRDMAVVFNLLRSNDMIWPFYINNYLLGKEPISFDLLYWNADSIRIPMALHLFYLENMYKDNLLKIPNGISVNGQKIDIGKIDIDCFAMAAKNDHIVPWNNGFLSAQLFSGDVEFILADGGHVAGVINHPDKNKYGYWKNSTSLKASAQPEDWLKDAEYSQGSWWPIWNDWLKKNSGSLVSRESIKEAYIEDSPGSYVKKRY